MGSEERRDVIVVGGGLAGLSAAFLLTRRGMRVRLIEQGRLLGGKLWMERELNPSRTIEHGIHGWWNTYSTFSWLMTELGLPSSILAPASAAGVLNPKRLDVFIEKGWQLPTPVNLLWQGRRSSAIPLTDALRAWRFFIHALAYDHGRDYEDYDDISILTLAERLGAPKSVQLYLIETFTLMFNYAKPEQISSAAFLSAINAYILRSGARVLPSWLQSSPDEAIFKPIVEQIRDGDVRGEVLMGRRVTSLVIRDGSIAGVQTGLEAVMDPALVPEDRYIEVPGSQGEIYIGRFSGEVRAFSSRCPHAGARVSWAEGAFRCPLHGAQFNAIGQVTNPPAHNPLQRLEVEERDDKLYLRGGHMLIPASQVIVATDVMSTRRLLAASEGVPAPLLERLSKLEASPLMVIRLWFKRAQTGFPRESAKDVAEELSSLIAPELGFIDGVFNVGRIYPETVREGRVIEIHVSDPTGEHRRLTDESILEKCLADLSSVDSTLVAANLNPSRPPVVQRYSDTFTLHSPRTGAHRPSAYSSVRGLRFAGDWTAIEHNAWFMEQAVISGFRAANDVLAENGLGVLELAPAPRFDWDWSLIGFMKWVSRGLRRLIRSAAAHP